MLVLFIILYPYTYIVIANTILYTWLHLLDFIYFLWLLVFMVDRLFIVILYTESIVIWSIWW
jgi:hypothetical protein